MLKCENFPWQGLYRCHQQKKVLGPYKHIPTEVVRRQAAFNLVSGWMLKSASRALVCSMDIGVRHQVRLLVCVSYAREGFLVSYSFA